MQNVTVSERSITHSYPLPSAETNKVLDKNIIKPNEPAQEIIALASQPGMMASILNGQRLMTYSDNRPSLSVPPVSQDKINPQQADRLIKMTGALKGRDINNLERAAASAAAALSAHSRSGQLDGKIFDSNKSMTTPAGLADENLSEVRRQRSHAAITGGTDITGAEPAGHQFINVMGDMKLVALNNTLTVTLTKSETEAAKASSKSTIRVVEAAERAGTRIINSEKERFNGAVTSGVVGIIGQSATSAGSLKAMHAESKSIKQNLKLAAQSGSSSSQHKGQLELRSDNMVHCGEVFEDDVTAHSKSHHTEHNKVNTANTNDHSRAQVDTHKMRVISDYGNQAVTATKSIIEGSYNVDAANETKQSELARADQTVNSEVANIQQQTARKAADARASLQQLFENTLNNNNSAVSTISDRMR